MTTSPRAISEAFAAQGAFFASGRTGDVAFRRDCLRNLANALQDRTDEALAALAQDLAKPPLEAWLAELHFLAAEIHHCTRHLTRWARPRRVRHPLYFLPARSEIRRAPFGRVLIAAPWNYPLQLALGPLLSALAAGNCVILKPSELAPATSDFLATLVASVFDPAHVTVVQGGAETGAALLDHPFDLFCYTGGETVGRLYAAAAARHLSPALLELGGKCPCLIDHDVPLDQVVERIVAAKFFNAGQTCVAPDFVLVPTALHDDFVERATSAITSMHGTGTSPDLAGIVNTRHYDRLLALVPPDAIRIGQDDRARRHLAPRLLPRARWDSPAMQEEIFGPLLPVLTYRDLDGTLDILRDRPSPLALYAFSRSSQTLEKIAAAVPSGAVCFNDLMKQAANPRIPLGGVGASGFGAYRDEEGFRTFTHPRPVTRRWFLPDPFLVKPPYRDRLRTLRKFLRG